MDEADRMLDLGFRDDLESILATLPEGHRTHLVSATFPREVRTLADAVQSDVVNVEGTPIGRANADIEHVLYVVHVHERFDAMVN
ncbi:DEAD/DEAH box helicase, partial [Clostridioides difficile]|uniref:DEAD/DEAH box helicase n=1 Tax=Clostridioides difficile TaxID=1496 RepID=UPI001EEEA3FA